jgi:tetratricopeptide (TPR) repeat protein
MRRLRSALPVVLLLLLSQLLAACASRPLSRSRTFLEDGLAERGVDPAEVEIPYALTPEMREWVSQRVPRIGSDESILNLLLHHLLSDGNLGITYDRGYTGDALEVFETRKANCLSFAHLYIGLSRYLGIETYYVGVKEVEGFEKVGDLMVTSGHVSVGYGPRHDQTVLEFDLGPQADYHYVERLSDLTAMALFYSNRGSERLRDGDVGAALADLEMSTRLDPELPAPWANYGVALRRAERPEEAETAYRRALELDPQFTTAYQNLASLVRRQGRVEEARELLALMETLGPRNPYSYLNLGDLSLAQGRTEEARRLYRQAVRRYRNHADSLAAMGLLELREGHRSEAEEWLDRAMRKDPDAERVRSLAARLQAPQS